MTSATAEVAVYPQYCFHLSPTIKQWCALRAADVRALTVHRDYKTSNVYFYKNLPIKFVRVAGVVIAIDQYALKRIYTLDDSSGATIECVVSVPKPHPGLPADTTATDTTTGAGKGTVPPAVEPPKQAPQQQQQQQQRRRQHQQTQQKQPVVDGEVEVGHVLDVKGIIKLFRGSKQVHAEKVTHLRTTEQELGFWDRVVQLRRDVLDKPWVLDRRTVRRLEREETRELGGSPPPPPPLSRKRRHGEEKNRHHRDGVRVRRRGEGRRRHGGETGEGRHHHHSSRSSRSSRVDKKHQAPEETAGTPDAAVGRAVERIARARRADPDAAKGTAGQARKAPAVSKGKYDALGL